LAKFKEQNAKFNVISDLENVSLQERIAFMGEAYDSIQAIEHVNKCTVCVNQSYYHICGITYRHRSCTSRADYSHPALESELFLLPSCLAKSSLKSHLSVAVWLSVLDQTLSL